MLFEYDSQPPADLDLTDDEDCQHLDDLHEGEAPGECGEGHRLAFSLATRQGGSICLLCLSNLVANPRAPTFHVSHALSQLSIALSHGPTLRSLLASRPHLLVSPLVRALSAFDDDRIARQVVDLVATLCGSHRSVLDEFVARVADRLSSLAFSWCPRQVFMLHCFGVLLNHCTERPRLQIKDEEALMHNLVAGLQLPSEEICGEILFVLYRLSILPNGSNDDGGHSDLLLAFGPKILHLSLEALMKTQNDTVRINCVALVRILVQKGLSENGYGNDLSSMSSEETDNNMQTTDDMGDRPLELLFAEAIKGPLLSSDTQLQVSTLDLIFHYLSREGTAAKSTQLLLDESIADYVFEVLRLSEYKDPLLSSCLQLLDLFSKSEKGFQEKLLVGFSTLIPALRYIAVTPYHPAEYQTLKLICSSVSDCPGLLSSSQVEELVLSLTAMCRRHNDGEMSMPPETFITVCSTFVALLESRMLHKSSNLLSSFVEATSYAILACLNISEEDPRKLLHALNLLKEAYGYSHQEVLADDSSLLEMRKAIADIYMSHLLPWIGTAINDVQEDVIIGLLETFRYILLHKSDIQATQFAELLTKYSWFSVSFGFLGLFPSNKMKCSVYSMLGSLVDIVLGEENGKPIRDAASNLPTDPNDLLFLLGQKSSRDTLLCSCQSAVLLILHASSLFDDRLADEMSILVALEQYILVNSDDLFLRELSTITLVQLVNLYGLHRVILERNDQIHYSKEAERILFYILTEYEWDLPSSRFHMLALKWLFQQEEITHELSFQLLKLCRNSTFNEAQVGFCTENSQGMSVQSIAELGASSDFHVARLLVCVLLQLLEGESQDLDIVSVINSIIAIINVSSTLTDQLCTHGIGNAIRTLLNNLNNPSSKIFGATLQLTFEILCSVNPEVLLDDEGWLAVTVKLLDFIRTRTNVQCFDDEALQVIAILSMILHLSKYEVLLESSKAIVFSKSLASIINRLIHDLCSKGPALLGYEIGTSTGRSLIFVLLLWYFSLRSLHLILPEGFDWYILLDSSERCEPLKMISISCQELSRFMHFGSPTVKLVASFSLLELMTRICNTDKELRCSAEHLQSVVAVLQGLIFDSDRRISVNCSRCLLMIMGRENQDTVETSFVSKNTWLRMIVEEMATSFAAPCLASNSLIDHQKPMMLIAIALLKLQNPPEWMMSVIHEPSISGLITKLAARNVSVEVVMLFQELLLSGFLNTEQIACLNRIFQECRQYGYTNDCQLDFKERKVKSVGAPEQVCEHLIHLMLADSSPRTDYKEDHQGSRQRLLDEIETFARISAAKQKSYVMWGRTYQRRRSSSGSDTSTI